MYPISIEFDYNFIFNCPSLIHGIAICHVQHSQGMLECSVCELAHSLFHFFRFCNVIISTPRELRCNVSIGKFSAISTLIHMKKLSLMSI